MIMETVGDIKNESDQPAVAWKGWAGSGPIPEALKLSECLVP